MAERDITERDITDREMADRAAINRPTLVRRQSTVNSGQSGKQRDGLSMKR
jgi:hypothetical protein